MINTLLIGKLIYQALTNDTEVANQVKINGLSNIRYKIYPIVAPDDTTFPFIVYTRANAFDYALSKDCPIGDKGAFQISVASDKYNDSAELANDVRKCFEGHIISNNELTISDIRMTSAAESYNENTYIQTLYFECEAE